MKEAGMSSIEIGSSLGIDSSLIRGWIRRYRREGPDGLLRRSAKSRNSHVVLLRRLTVGSVPAVTDPTRQKGFVHYADNPALVRTKASALTSFGIRPENIIVGNDIFESFRSLAAGDVLVLHSLHDLSGDPSGLFHALEKLLRAGITVVSISDNGQEIRPFGSPSAELVALLGNYITTEYQQCMNERMNERIQGIMKSEECIDNRQCVESEGPSVRKPYEPLSIQLQATAPASPILAASVVATAKIQSIGQELAPVYDLSAEGGIDTNTGKTFSHEWEAGGPTL